MTRTLTLVLAFWLAAAVKASTPMAWDFTSPKVWQQGGIPQVRNDFGRLGETTPEGFHFRIDKKYRNVWLEKLPTDTAKKYSHLEIFHRGRQILYSVLVYGEGEGGYERFRNTSGAWPGEDRFYANRHVVPLNTNERWRQGGVRRLVLTISNSGEGQDATLVAMAFRRAADTLRNGALMLHDKTMAPFHWSVETRARLTTSASFPLPVCAVEGGSAATELVSLKPDHRYIATCYLADAAAAVKIFDRDGTLLAEHPLAATADKQGGLTLFRAEYTVPEDAHHGVLALSGKQPYRFADALVEDLGGQQTWRAEWLWTPEGTRNQQDCYFRKEFEVADPARLKSAFIQATCDDAFTLEVNNNRIFNNNVWSNPMHAEVKKYLKPGRNVITASGHNEGSAAGFLCELKLVPAEGDPVLVATDATWLCRTTPPGDNWRRIVPPKETRAGWIPAKSLGVPPAPPWKNMVRHYEEMPKPLRQVPLDKEKYARRKTVARINRDLDFPRIEVNGEIIDHLIYGPTHRGDRTNAYNFLQTSKFKVFRIMWEFSFEAWRADGTIDYSGLENTIQELLTNIPDAKIILCFRLSPPGFWQRRHPDELVKFADGKTTGADGVFASPASKVFRQEITAKVAEFVRHIEGSWYGSAVIGYNPMNLRGPEWVLAMKHNCFPDYSRPMQEYFRGYLREKYGTDDALRKAWGDPGAAIDTAEIPPQNQRQLKLGFFLPPERQNVMDYNRALQRANVDSIMMVLDTIHKAAPDKLRVLYFGYLMTLTHISMNPASTGHYDLSRLLAANKVDVMISPITYRWRKPGDISGCGSVESTYRKHGVVWLQEADNRTYLTPGDAHAVTHNAAASLDENWREFLYAMLKREAVWFYEIGGGWYDNRYIHEDFRQMLGLYREAVAVNPTYQPKVALFFDEHCPDGLTLNDGRWGAQRPFNLAADAQYMPARCGVPYDIFELEDLYDLDLSRYQVLYFQNAWRKNPRLASFLREKAYPAGKTVVWLYAPGYGQGGGLGAMKELTGIDFELLPMGTALRMRTRDGRIVGGKGMDQAEVFAAKVPRGAALATYPGTARAAAARVQIGNGASVWLATYDPTGRMLRQILKDAGVQTLIDRDDRVLFDGRDLGVFVLDGPGPRTVTLPDGIRPASVTDLRTGKPVPFQGRTFQFDAAPGDIRLFRIR